jgi:hypothetical protein
MQTSQCSHSHLLTSLKKRTSDSNVTAVRSTLLTTLLKLSHRPPRTTDLFYSTLFSYSIYHLLAYEQFIYYFTMHERKQEIWVVFVHKCIESA